MSEADSVNVIPSDYNSLINRWANNNNNHLRHQIQLADIDMQYQLHWSPK